MAARCVVKATPALFDGTGAVIHGNVEPAVEETDAQKGGDQAGDRGGYCDKGNEERQPDGTQVGGPTAPEPLKESITERRRQ